jgi:hypothetical protein
LCPIHAAITATGTRLTAKRWAVAEGRHCGLVCEVKRLFSWSDERLQPECEGHRLTAEDGGVVAVASAVDRR